MSLVDNNSRPAPKVAWLDSIIYISNGIEVNLCKTKTEALSRIELQIVVLLKTVAS